MRSIKLSIKVITAAVAIATTTPVVSPVSNPIRVEAASVKLSSTYEQLYVGSFYKLKVKGTKSKVKWNSSNRGIATVNSKGGIVALSSGTAYITATVKKKKYTCVIEVLEAVNQIEGWERYVSFGAKEVKISFSYGNKGLMCKVGSEKPFHIFYRPSIEGYEDMRDIQQAVILEVMYL